MTSIVEMTAQELADRIVEITGSKAAAKRLIQSMPEPPPAPKRYPTREKARDRRWLVFDLYLYGHKRKTIAAHIGRSINRVAEDLDRCRYEKHQESQDLLQKMFGPNAWFAMDANGDTYIEVNGRPLEMPPLSTAAK